ncbi:MAG: radical SAM protein [Candidatus Thiodiazotropha sp.]
MPSILANQTLTVDSVNKLTMNYRERCPMSQRPKRILLLSPPNDYLEQPWAMPRLGLLVLSSVLKKHGHQVRLRQLGSLSEMPNLLEEDTDLLGISATTREYPDALSILNYCKRQFPNLPVMIGGAHANAMPEECQRNGFDVVVAGEADEVIAKLVENLSNNPILVRPRPVVHLDSLPIPDHSGFNDPLSYQSYFDDCTRVGPAAPIELSRGCPYKCSFCGPHSYYRRYGPRHVEVRLRTLAQLNYRAVIVVDDLPFLNLQQVRTFCAAIKRYDLRFRCNMRANLITTQIATELSRAGCYRVQIGVESAADDVLAGIHKRLQSQAVGEAVQICQDAGIQVKAMFVWGLPSDGPQSAQAIVDWVRRFRPASIQVSSFVPLPGSPLWNNYCGRVVDYHHLNFFDHNGQVMGVGNDRYSPTELAAWRKRILRDCQGLTHLDLGMTAIPSDEESRSIRPEVAQ